MKKNLLLLLVCMCCASVSFAQMKVSNNGKVGIGLPSNVAPSVPLTIGNGVILGSSNYVSMSAPPATCQTTLSIVNSGYSGSSRRYGLTSQLGPVPGESAGIMGNCSSPNYSPQGGTAYGVLGVAGNFNQNYGVMGVLEGTQKGAGIVGSVNNQTVAIPSGQYAGYFNGNVNVIGTLSATNISGSDVRFKKDISELDSKKSLKSILMMKPVEYRLEQQYIEVTSVDSVSKSEVTKQCSMYDEKSQVFQKKHYGLIAQELQQLYPDLVYEVDDRGYLGINYMEIIPMLIQSVQEQQKQIDDQQRQNEDQQKQIDKLEQLVSSKSILKSSEETGDVTGISSETITNKATLYQNVPNPFNQSTEIRYYIPENSQSAQLCIYNLQGNQIKRIVVAERGENSYLLSASELTAGMYLYTLIIDGKEIDTKRMILTE